LLVGAIGFLVIGAITTFILSAPLLLGAATHLDALRVGFLVSIGGLVGAVAMLLAGNYADRHGQRFLHAFWWSLLLAGALGVISLAPAPLIVMAAYLAFAAACFTIPMLTASGWAEVIPVRELAVGAAAINTLSQIGAFLSPFAWGALKDATGSFHAGLLGLVCMTLLLAVLILTLHRRVQR
jgi:ACS family tartrate transporter-like MFS transporter